MKKAVTKRTRVLRVQPIGFEPPVAIGAGELASYLPRLSGHEVQVLPALPRLPRNSSAELVLGTSEHLRGLGLGRLPKSHDLDDALFIIPRNGTLFLTGSNPRSVLFAVYRLLEELGAVFLRPGPGGEVLPSNSRARLPTTPVKEKASYRHRGICIEGYPRLEHVLGLLDWMAKKKMNTFHLEFPDASFYWDRGYRQSPEIDAAVRSKPLTAKDRADIESRVLARARELGMIIHRGGHGWTAMVLGRDGSDPRPDAKAIVPPERREWVAMVNGKREFWKGRPTNTELCYSNPAARAAFAQVVLAYAQQHPEADVIHVWSGDAPNNRCECEACRRRTVTDWYVLQVNEIALALRRAGVAKRIVFLGYLDSLWPPETERVADGNLIFMYAPISRCYGHTICDPTCDDKSDDSRPPLNQVRLPRRNRLLSRLVRKWSAVGDLDRFVFEYYRWAPTWYDGMGMDLGKIAAQDVRDLRSLGLNGAISNDCIRAFYPLPHLANAMADTLWNVQLDPVAHRRKVMRAAFGSHSQRVEKYFAWLIAMYRHGVQDYHCTVSEGPITLPWGLFAEIAEGASQAEREFMVLAGKSSDDAVKLSLRLLAAHAGQMGLFARICEAGERKDRRRIAQLRNEHRIRLPELLSEFDIWVDPIIAWPIRVALSAAEEACGHGRASGAASG